MNLTPQHYLNIIQDKNIQLTAKNDEYAELMKDHTEAEYTFNVAYTEKILRLKIDGEPVTTQKTIALGDKVIAKLKLELDVADAMVKACKQSMRVLEKGIDSARSGLSWLKIEKYNTK